MLLNFQLVLLSFQLIARNSQLVTCNSCFTISLENITYQSRNNCSSFNFYFVSFSRLHKHPNSFSLSLMFKANTFRIIFFNVIQASMFFVIGAMISSNKRLRFLHLSFFRFVSVLGMQNEQKNTMDNVRTLRLPQSSSEISMLIYLMLG